MCPKRAVLGENRTRGAKRSGSVILARNKAPGLWSSRPLTSSRNVFCPFLHNVFRMFEFPHKVSHFQTPFFLSTGCDGHPLLCTLGCWCFWASHVPLSDDFRLDGKTCFAASEADNSMFFMVFLSASGLSVGSQSQEDTSSAGLD